MRNRPQLIAALVTIAVAALAVRVLSIAEPLGIDQSLWASAVRGMSRHQLLYRDVWEQRPPGIYFTYLAGFNIFGWTPAAVAWLDLLASAATALLLFAIVRRLSTATTGAVAAALYATLTMPGWLYRHDGFLERSVCETFIVVCVALSAWAAVRVARAPVRTLGRAYRTLRRRGRCVQAERWPVSARGSSLDVVLPPASAAARDATRFLSLP
jgi:4-amino-4-deoxy-L-arabinose transferase-like glycosyltransferase